MADYPKCPACGATGPRGTDITHCGCTPDEQLTAWTRRYDGARLRNAMETAPVFAASKEPRLDACSSRYQKD